jgi:hypothetical protein
MTQNPFNIAKLGWVGVPVRWLGVTYWSTLPIFGPDGVTVVTPGTPGDVSLWRFRLRVKAKYSDPDSAAIFAPPDWQIASGAGTNGQVPVPEMPSTVTVNLRPGILVWDIKAIIPDSTEPMVIFAGTIAIGNTAGTDLFTLPS